MTRVRGLILALLATLLTSAGFVTVNAVISAGTAAANSPFLTEEELEIRELAREKEKERLAKAREHAKAMHEKAAEKEKELATAAREKAKEKKVAEHEEYKRLLEEAKGGGNQAEVEAEVLAKEEKAKEEAAGLLEKEKAKAMARHEKLSARIKAFPEKAKEKAREHRAIDEEHLREKKEKELLAV